MPPARRPFVPLDGAGVHGLARTARRQRRGKRRDQPDHVCEARGGRATRQWVGAAPYRLYLSAFAARTNGWPDSTYATHRRLYLRAGAPLDYPGRSTYAPRPVRQRAHLVLDKAPNRGGDRARETDP